MPVGKYVTHAMKGWYVSKSLQVGGPDAFNTFLWASFHDRRVMLNTVFTKKSTSALVTLLSNSKSRIQPAVLPWHAASLFLQEEEVVSINRYLKAAGSLCSVFPFITVHFPVVVSGSCGPRSTLFFESSVLSPALSLTLCSAVLSCATKHNDSSRNTHLC